MTELKMRRFSLGVMGMDKMRDELIRGTARIGRFEDKAREAKYGNLKTCIGATEGVLVEGCEKWRRQVEGKEEIYGCGERAKTCSSLDKTSLICCMTPE